MRRLTEIHVTPRDLEVLKCLSEGLSNPEIGERLGIGTRTVKAHLHRMFMQMDLRAGSGSRIRLAAEYHRVTGEMPLLAS